MKMRCLVFLFLLPVFTTVLSGSAGAEPQEGDQVPKVPDDSVRVEADELTYDARNLAGTASGNVRIFYQEATLEAEEVFIDLDDKTSYARERVRLLQGRDILECDALSYHWETQTGSLQKGNLLFEETGYYIRAGLLEKTGQDTYHIEQGSFTTCLCPSPDDRLPWEVRAQEGEITLGGYAKIKKATFRILRIPVFYFPLTYVPVKLDRDSGFLMPGIGNSGRHGWEFSLPYYWAINASLDATFLLEGLTDRGVKPGVEFRYRPSKKTAGQFNVSVINDHKADEFRYGVRAEHFQRLSSSFYDKLELKIVSDNKYTEDFPWEITDPADRIVGSRGIVGFHRGNFHATLEGNFDDLVAGLGGDRIPQRLPHVHVDFVRTPVGVPWLSLGWQSEAIHFMDEMGDRRWREQLFPQGTVTLRPLHGVSLNGGVGIREVLSQNVGDSWGGEGSQHRTLLQTGAQAEGSVGRGFQWGPYRLHHSIRPRIGYQYIRELAGDPFPVIFDGLDQLRGRNLLTYSIYTSLWGKVEDTLPAGRRGVVGELYVVNSMDFEQDPIDSPSQKLFSDVRIGFRLQPRPYFAIASKFQIDPYAGSLRIFEVGTSFSDKMNRYGIQLGYLESDPYLVDALTRVEVWDAYDLVFLFPGIDKTLRSRIRARFSPRWSAALTTLYLVELSGKIENHLAISYLSVCDCWSIILRVDQTVRPDDIGFSVQFRLVGLGSYF
jgi:LPS-assembly protein